MAAFIAKRVRFQNGEHHSVLTRPGGLPQYVLSMVSTNAVPLIPSTTGRRRAERETTPTTVKGEVCERKRTMAGDGSAHPLREAACVNHRRQQLKDPPMQPLGSSRFSQTLAHHVQC